MFQRGKFSKYGIPIYYKDGCNKELCLDCFQLFWLSVRVANVPPSSQNDISMDKMRRVLNSRVEFQLNIQDITEVNVIENLQDVCLIS